MLGVKERTHPARVCPLCRDALDAEAGQRCAGCETVYHPQCLAELGGCATLGCRLKGELPGGLEHWQCRACHAGIDQPLWRRRCPCGACLHDGCVEAHAAVCERALELRRAPREAPQPPAAPSPDRRAATRRARPRGSDWLDGVQQTVLFVGVVGLMVLSGELHGQGQLERSYAAQLMSGVCCLALAAASVQRGEFPTRHGSVVRHSMPIRFWLGILAMLGFGLSFVIDAARQLL